MAATPVDMITLTVTMRINAHADAHVQTPEGLHAEVRSWLESVGVTVHEVSLSWPQPASDGILSDPDVSTFGGG